VTGSVVVIGAINVDLVVSGSALPAPGQTVTGGVFAQHHGGNITAARVGTRPWRQRGPSAAGRGS
jgi:ribokinase